MSTWQRSAIASVLRQVSGWSGKSACMASAGFTKNWSLWNLKRSVSLTSAWVRMQR